MHELVPTPLNQNKLLKLKNMARPNKEMLQEVRIDQNIGSCEQWLNIKNDQDYLHPIEKRSELFVRRILFRPCYTRYNPWIYLLCQPKYAWLQRHNLKSFLAPINSL